MGEVGKNQIGTRHKDKERGSISADDNTLCGGDGLPDLDAEILHALQVFENHLKGLYKQHERLKRLQKIRQTQFGLSSTKTK